MRTHVAVGNFLQITTHLETWDWKYFLSLLQLCCRESPTCQCYTSWAHWKQGEKHISNWWFYDKNKYHFYGGNSKHHWRHWYYFSSPKVHGQGVICCVKLCCLVLCKIYHRNSKNVSFCLFEEFGKSTRIFYKLLLTPYLRGEATSVWKNSLKNWIKIWLKKWKSAGLNQIKYLWTNSLGMVKTKKLFTS